MNNDVLLMWLSEVQKGTWEQFKATLRSLHDTEDDWKAGNIARQLSALGHVEFAWEPRSIWSVCPPTLVGSPRRAQPTTCLCGQRSDSLLQDLKREAGHLAIKYEETTQREAPKVIHLYAKSPNQFAELAQRLAITYTSNVIEQIAVCVPHIALLISSSKQIPLPALPPIASFNNQMYEWQDVNRITVDGLYRFENFSPDYRLIRNGSCYKVQRETGIYAELSHKIWEYDSEIYTLAIPKGLLPPPLYQRVLVLCSGFLAQFDYNKRSWIYRDVPPAIAHVLATKLNQSLEAVC